MLRKQTELDSAVKELAIAMVKLFSWVKETEALDQKLQHFCKTIELMAQQATECALFVKDYASRGFLGMQNPLFPLAVNIFSYKNRPNSTQQP